MWKRLDGKESESPGPSDAVSQENKTNADTKAASKTKPVVKQLDGLVPSKTRRGPQTTKKVTKNPSKPYDSSPDTSWDPSHFKLFVGNLSTDITDEKLRQAFSSYKSLSKTQVVFDKRRDVSKGYGFIAFSDSEDYLNAFREMNNKYIGAKPVQLKRANPSKR